MSSCELYIFLLFINYILFLGKWGDWKEGVGFA